MNIFPESNLIKEWICLSDRNIPEEEKKRHIERYEFAREFLKPNWIVLDAACGSGYGSEILATKVKRVIGIDVNQEALNYAKNYHKRDNIIFLLTDLNEKIPFPDNSFNAIISFETLEHIKNQEFLLSEFKRVLKKGGILIISTPDRNITEIGKIKTPYHFRELKKDEFCSLLSKFFKIKGLYGQTLYKFLPRWKKIFRQILLRLDFLKIRKIIIRGKIKENIKKEFNSLIYTPIQKIELDTPSRHWVLLAIAEKL